jgi:uncharacterized ion transporter superfamily protein YfcC
MDKIQIIIFAAAMAILAVRLYQKYVKKDKRTSETERKREPGSYFQSSSKDDDYEPYSKK